MEIIKFIIVGFVEETVFRGWGYNALSTVVTDKKAIIYSTALFAVLHWPAYLVKYYRLGVMDFSAMLIQSITAALFGVLFCRLFEKGKSLWNPIIVHIVYDVFTVLLVG